MCWMYVHTRRLIHDIYIIYVCFHNVNVKTPFSDSSTLKKIEKYYFNMVGKAKRIRRQEISMY